MPDENQKRVNEEIDLLAGGMTREQLNKRKKPKPRKPLDGMFLLIFMVVAVFAIFQYLKGY